jgi:hypothetical protein
MKNNNYSNNKKSAAVQGWKMWQCSRTINFGSEWMRLVTQEILSLLLNYLLNLLFHIFILNNCTPYFVILSLHDFYLTYIIKYETGLQLTYCKTKCTSFTAVSMSGKLKREGIFITLAVMKCVPPILHSPLLPSPTKAQMYSSFNHLIFTLINQISSLLTSRQHFLPLQGYLGTPTSGRSLHVFISTITFRSLKLNVNCSVTAADFPDLVKTDN